jgi:cytochrome b561
MKAIRDENQRYTTVAIVLHWAIAALIVFNLAFGFFMEGFEPALKGIVVPLHISSGITVLGLSVVRLVWRLLHRPPPFSPDLTAWERIAAHAVHGALYFIMIAMPLTGWAIISAHPPRPGAGPVIWGLLHIPPISAVSHIDPTVQPAVHDRFVEIHSIGGWLTLGLLTLHVAAALKHQFYDRHAEFARMGIGASSRERENAVTESA